MQSRQGTDPLGTGSLGRQDRLRLQSSCWAPARVQVLSHITTPRPPATLGGPTSFPQRTGEKELARASRSTRDPDILRSQGHFQTRPPPGPLRTPCLRSLSRTFYSSSLAVAAPPDAPKHSRGSLR